MKQTTHLHAGQEEAAWTPPLDAPSVARVETRAESCPVTQDSQEGFAGLNELMEQEHSQLRRRRSLSKLTWPLAAWVLWAVYIGAAHFTVHVGGLVVSLMALFGGLLSYEAFRTQQHRRRLIAAMSSEKHTAAQAGALIQAMRADVNDLKVSNLAKTALIDVLPRLKADDAARLTDADRAGLMRELMVSPNINRDFRVYFSRRFDRQEVALRVAILKAMEQIGGAQELPLVSRLAQSGSLSKWAAPPPEIVAAARECLPFVEQRAGREIANRQLLRASSGDGAPESTLLRAAEGSRETPPDELLRAAPPTAES